MKIAIATYKDAGAYSAPIPQEDALLADFLTQKEVNFAFEVWDNPEVDWKSYDAVIIKSPWDYFEKVETWFAWLNHLEQLNIQVYNPIKTLRWNSDKKYLFEIEKAGHAIVPSINLEKGTNIHLEELMNNLGCDAIVVKPRISGAALNTYLISRAEIESYQPKVNDLLQVADYLAQPLIPEIQTKGEWSFVFFKAEFSHCLLKTAKEGDFRVQHFHGGTIHPQIAPEHLLSSAQKIASQFAADCLYARVDGVEINGELFLMELELIEPLLFMFTHEKAMENYYAALLKQMA